VSTEGRQVLDLEAGCKAYVVDYEELRPLEPKWLEYQGTTNGYHIVTWWVKLLPAATAAREFAVPVGQFAPEREFSYQGIKPYNSGFLFAE
jgi:hypothetical protein